MKIEIKIALWVGVILLLISPAFYGMYSDLQTDIVRNCKVIDLQQQQIISGSSNNVKTEIRYLIVTDKELFISETSFLNGKFDNSNIFWHLKKGQTYDFKVCGLGKGLSLDYRNVLEVINDN